MTIVLAGATGFIGRALVLRLLGEGIASPRPVHIERGAVIDYRIAVAGVPLRWRTAIEVWEPGVRFAPR